MAGYCRVKAGAHRFAVADGLAELRVQLRDIIGVFRGHPFRDPPVFCRNRQLGEGGTDAARPLQHQRLALHRVARGRGQHEVAFLAMDLEQEVGSAPHAAAYLKRHDGAIAGNAADCDLVGDGLNYHLAGFGQWYAVALADRIGRQLAELAKAMAQRIDRMPAGDRQ